MKQLLSTATGLVVEMFLLTLGALGFILANPTLDNPLLN
jgi:hypothetical protein